MLVVTGLFNYRNTVVKPTLLQRSLKMVTRTKITAFNTLIQIVPVTSRRMKFLRNNLRIASLGFMTHWSRNTIA
jgi:hypothetical protein